MDRLLTPEQVAEKLGVKLCTIYQWTHEGYIPYVKLGRLVRFDLKAIEKWIAEKSTQGRPSRAVDLTKFGL
jgi:excisionase family DNA binding protein